MDTKKCRPAHKKIQKKKKLKRKDTHLLKPNHCCDFRYISEGSITSSDSGHGSYIPSGSGSGVSEFHSDNMNGSSNNGGGNASFTSTYWIL